MLIRTATIDDANKLIEIYSPYVEQTAISFEYKVPSSDEFKDRIEKISKRFPYIIAEKNGDVLGYAYANVFKAREAYSKCVETTIYVSQDERRNGIGSILYKELEKRLNDMGITNLYACIAYPIVEDEYLTLDSIKFHKKLGFETVGHFHKCGMKFGKYYDMEWLEKII